VSEDEVDEVDEPLAVVELPAACEVAVLGVSSSAAACPSTESALANPAEGERNDA
jgi:hypothetical protein